MKKKVRKPRPFNLGETFFEVTPNKNIRIWSGGYNTVFHGQTAKKVQKWLSKAIAYLEQENPAQGEK